MKTLQLSQGQVALVDDEDFEALAKFKWHAGWYPSSKTYYAKRNVKLDGGRKTTALMHRELMGAAQGQEVDHINHNGLDNRRENVRLCIRTQNNGNMRKRTGCSSQYKGVVWCKNHELWMVRVKRKLVGYFVAENEAAQAYNRVAREKFGEFALLNEVSL